MASDLLVDGQLHRRRSAFLAARAADHGLFGVKRVGAVTRPVLDREIGCFGTVVDLEEVVGVVSLGGITAYQRWLKNWKYRSLLILVNIAVSLFACLDIVLYTRANKKVGIPDHLFVIGSEGMQSLLEQWQWMPGVVLMSHLCPEGQEATMYISSPLLAFHFI